MILRVDRLQTELPPPSDPDPAGADAVQDLEIAEEAQPEGAEAHDLPAQPAVFAPSYAPEEIVEIAGKLRSKAGFTTAGSS